MLDEMNLDCGGVPGGGAQNPVSLPISCWDVPGGLTAACAYGESARAVPACWVLVAVYLGLGVLWRRWAREVDQIYENRIAL